MLSPHFSRLKFLPVLFIIVALLSGCNLSLAGDVTPPPNYRPPTPEPTTPPVQVTYPVNAPSVQQGQAIYTEKCLPCHGETGMGDGPQAANLPNPPAAIGSPDVARQAIPSEWFKVVYGGNMQNFMPGFSGSLNASQIWDVLAYVYSLSSTSDQLAQGKDLYDQKCAVCHGPAGKGDGTQAASLSTKLTDLTQQPFLPDLSDANLVDLIVQGKGEMPAMGDQLSDAQRWALAAYTRSLSAASSNSAPESASSAPSSGSPATATTQPGNSTETFQSISVTGKVTNGTPGGSVPDGVKVTLLGFDQNMVQVFSSQADAKTDGSYEFGKVDFQSTYVYVVQAEANGTVFNSDILHGTDVTTQTVSLPVKIYDTTTDTSALKADRMHIFFDFSNPGVVQVVELFIISNPTDKVVVPPTSDTAVLNFTLPDGATNLQFQDSTIGARYIQTDKGFGDRQSVEPGQSQHQVLYAYDMPYTDKLTLNLVSPLPVDFSDGDDPAEWGSVGEQPVHRCGRPERAGDELQAVSVEQSDPAG